EGKTSKVEISHLRKKQMKNFLLALFVSQGIPMLLMGDEYGHTKNGNNNTWCHDSKLNWFLWDKLHGKKSLYEFTRKLIHFRRDQPLFHHKNFLEKDAVDWHGVLPFQPDWSFTSKLVAYTLKDHECHNDLYIAFHSGDKPLEITLPSLIGKRKWCWVVDTDANMGKDFIDPANRQSIHSEKLRFAPYSAIMLIAN
ncbi:MAG: isA3, partial [Chlamydiia bacterium]|nr:isA3 [Chlamydiia bacterium]